MFGNLFKKDAILEKKIELATSELLQDPNWGLNLELTEHGNRTVQNGKNLVNGVKRRFSNKNKKIVYFALELCSTMVSNANSTLLKLIEKSIVGEVQKVYFRRSSKKGFGAAGLLQRDPLNVANKCLELIYNWNVAFERQSGQYPNFSKVYKNMLQKGVRFDLQKKDAAPINLPDFSEEQLNKIVDEADAKRIEEHQRRHERERKQSQNPPMNSKEIPWKDLGFEKWYHEHLLTDLEQSISTATLIREIIEASVSTSEVKSNDILKMVIHDAEEAHRRLMLLLIEIEIPIVVDLLIHMNDFLHQTIELYKHKMRGEDYEDLTVSVENICDLISTVCERLENPEDDKEVQIIEIEEKNGEEGKIQIQKIEPEKEFDLLDLGQLDDQNQSKPVAQQPSPMMQNSVFSFISSEEDENSHSNNHDKQQPTSPVIPSEQFSFINSPPQPLQQQQQQQQSFSFHSLPAKIQPVKSMFQNLNMHNNNNNIMDVPGNDNVLIQNNNIPQPSLFNHPQPTNFQLQQQRPEPRIISIPEPNTQSNKEEVSLFEGLVTENLDLTQNINNGQLISGEPSIFGFLNTEESNKNNEHVLGGFSFAAPEQESIETNNIQLNENKSQNDGDAPLGEFSFTSAPEQSSFIEENESKPQNDDELGEFSFTSSSEQPSVENNAIQIESTGFSFIQETNEVVEQPEQQIESIDPSDLGFSFVANSNDCADVIAPLVDEIIPVVKKKEDEPTAKPVAEIISEPESAEPELEMTEVYIKNMKTQEAFTILCPINATMLDVKKEIERLQSHDVERQILVHSRGQVQDDELIAEVKSSPINTVKLVVRGQQIVTENNL